MARLVGPGPGARAEQVGQDLVGAQRRRRRRALEEGGPRGLGRGQGEAQPVPLPLQVALYRLAQELTQNVVKHAQATQALLEVDSLPGWLMLRVEDNGRGFDPAAPSRGIGLSSLRSRVALLGGSVQLSTAPGQGTRVQVRVPL